MKYENLKLERQLCFPLYAAAREVVKIYTPYLEPLGLTYTQYIAMLVLWEKKTVTAKDLGKRLFLDSGTLTPLLKSMERKGLVSRKRSTSDGRLLDVAITKAGEALAARAAEVPQALASALPIEKEEAETLYQILYKFLK